MHVLIDDFRDLTGMDIICRTPEAGLEVVSMLRPSHLYIDHDLGCELDGYQVIIGLLRNNKCPRNVQIVSDNPVGVQNISRALVACGYVVAMNGRNFYKPPKVKDNF